MNYGKLVFSKIKSGKTFAIVKREKIHIFICVEIVRKREMYLLYCWCGLYYKLIF